jgi:hypothetical protein
MILKYSWPTLTAGNVVKTYSKYDDGRFAKMTLGVLKGCFR